MRERRFPVYRHLKECGVPTRLSDYPDSYVSTQSSWAFVSRSAREAGVDDLGLRVSRRSIQEIMGPAILGIPLRSPTLLAGIRSFANLCGNESSGMSAGVSLQAKTALFHLQKPFGAETPGFTQTEWRDLMSMIELVRFYAGKSWTPDVVSRKSPKAIPRLAYRIFPNTRFLTGQRLTLLGFPDKLLRNGPSEYGTRVGARLDSDTEDRRPRGPARSFEGSLRQIIQSHLPDGYPSLRLVAAIAGTSPRTLQRRLAEVGTRYSALVQESRIGVAVQLLKDTDASLLQISLKVGYEDSSHFARAFRRSMGTCPRDYRIQRRAILQASVDSQAACASM